MSAANDFSMEGCANLVVTLAGGADAGSIWDAITSENMTMDGSDGYMASYVFSGVNPDGGDATCFGFEEDEEGYFCIGAEINAGAYVQHQAGYWNWTEEEKAEWAEAEAEYNNLVEQGYTDEEIEIYLEMNASAEVDDYEEEESVEEFIARGNPMAADYVPAQFCESLYDEELGDMSDEHCYGVEEFTGAWYQPYESETYEGNFRFSAGMTAWAGCEANAVEGVIMQGASALAAGAATVLLAAAY